MEKSAISESAAEDWSVQLRNISDARVRGIWAFRLVPESRESDVFGACAVCDGDGALGISGCGGGAMVFGADEPMATQSVGI